MLVASHYASSFLLSSAFAAEVAGTAVSATARTLVLIQLAGGNDGLNTIVPFEDADYYRLRPTLALSKSQVLPLSELLGLHPACTGLHGLFKEGKLTVVQNVGHTQPSLSHVRAAETWAVSHEASDSPTTGWLGRYLDSLVEITPPAGGAAGVYFNSTVPLDLQSADPARVVDFSSDLRLQALARAHLPASDYPPDSFGTSLRNLAALIAAGAAPRIATITLDGFDTHANQTHPHENRLRILASGLHAFQRDLESTGAAQRVLTVTCSEFGRRAAENENRGTGHGTAAPLFLMGSNSTLRGGFVGNSPSLRISAGQQLQAETDFRQVYTTVLEDWLGTPAEPLLGSAYPKLDLFASGIAPAAAPTTSDGV